MSNSPEQVRLEIERARSELSDNVNALGDKVSPGSIARRQAGRVRGAATSVKDAVMGSATDAADNGRQVASTMAKPCPMPPARSPAKHRAPPSPPVYSPSAQDYWCLRCCPASKVEQQAADKVKDTATIGR